MATEGVKSLLLLASINVFGGLIFGYNMGIIADAQLALQKEYKLSDLSVGILTSSLLLGAMFGSMVGGTLADKIGRKKAMIVNSVLALLSSIGLAASPIFVVVCIVRVLVGVSVGLSSVICPLYVSELAPPSRRGILGTLFQLFITFGIVIAYLVGLGVESTSLSVNLQWRVMFLGAALPPLCLLLISIFFMVESPFWRASGKKSDETPLIGNASAKGWGELFSRRQLRSLFLGVTLAIALSLTGINAIMFYAPVIFRLAGFANETLWTFFLGLWNFFATLLAVVVVDRLGRKPLLVSGLGMVVIGNVVAGIAFWLLSGSVKGVMAVSALALFVFGYAVGPGATFFVLINEIFDATVREEAGSLMNVIQWFINLVLATLFKLALAQLGEPLIFGFFAAVALVTGGICAVMLRETKGRAIGDVSQTVNNPTTNSCQ